MIAWMTGVCRAEARKNTRFWFWQLGLFSDDEEPGGGTDSRGGGQQRGDDESRVGPAGLEMPV